MNHSRIPTARLAWLSLLAGALFLGCQPDSDEPVTKESASAAPAPEETARPEPSGPRTLTLDDGATLIYETAGEGDPAVVMIHCWGCNRHNWREQVDPLVAAGYQVVTMDLPGHGDAGRERDDWRIATYANDVRQLVAHLDLDRVVLVGHSMGGPVSVMAAPLLDAEVAGIVCVDTLHDAEFEWPEGFAEEMVAGMHADFPAALDGFLPQLFRPGADPELMAWVRDQALAADSGVLTALMADFPNLDMPALMASADTPIRCINAAPDPGSEMGMATRVETNRKYADFDALLMEEVGHYPQLEAPERFNRHLLDELANLAGQRE